MDKTAFEDLLMASFIIINTQFLTRHVVSAHMIDNNEDAVPHSHGRPLLAFAHEQAAESCAEVALLLR